MIRLYVQDIQTSLKNKCYFSALALTLALPDMCGAIEFPSAGVGERYINWYDKYLGPVMKQGKNNLGGDSTWLSGEIVYNLRNTFLHLGNPGIVPEKIKTSENQLDKFALILGDGTVLWYLILDMETNPEMGKTYYKGKLIRPDEVDPAHKMGKLTYKFILVDISYLCGSICDCALWYYNQFSDKFHFDFSAIPQEEFLRPSTDTQDTESKDIMAEILNRKLKKQNSPFHVEPQHDSFKSMQDAWNMIQANEDVKNQLMNEEKIVRICKSDAGMEMTVLNKEATASETPVKTHDTTEIINPKTSHNGTTNESESLKIQDKETELSSFFDKHFRKLVYREKKNQIIKAVLFAKTKQQVNNELQKLFPNQQVKVIYQRFQPYIKDLPGNESEISRR